MPSQREWYRSTVHLFIGKGRSPCRITFMPFTFINNSIVILRGLICLFIFKSVPLLCYHAEAFLRTASWSPYPSSRSGFVLTMLLYTHDPIPKIPVHIFHLENIVKSCFWGPSEAEDPQQYQLANKHFETKFEIHFEFRASLGIFQNLNFWDATNLPHLKGISSSRFGLEGLWV
jgi:hypothetical protein